MIQVNHLTKRYGSTLAVRDLSFSVAEGEIVGFLGPNGAGKSTTMNIITGCLEATEGTVTIGGLDSCEQPEKVRRLIGYLPEQPPLYPDMTVKEYLDFVYRLKKCTLPKQEHLESIAARAGLTEVTGRLIRNLSKGFRQRVGLAQALLGDPKVLILDEPTVGLDPKQIIEIRDLIRTLGKNHTVILSSHILSEVQEICDRVIVIHQGCMVADGTTEELSRRMTGSVQLEMVIEGSAEQVLGVLRAVPGVASVLLLEQDGKKASYRITAEEDADIRHDVFHSLAQNSLAILSMNQVQASLEDIFLKLTDADVAEVPEELVPEKPKKHLFRKRGDRK
jgi:ABC-2 type transport system ATP-binding protein